MALDPTIGPPPSSSGDPTVGSKDPTIGSPPSDPTIGSPPPSDPTVGTPAPSPSSGDATVGLPHRSDSGNGIFNHPSTNRGGTPGILNGLRVEAVPHLPNLRESRPESASSREEHQRRADLARHNRSGS